MSSDVTTNYVDSEDDTRISYRQLGSGPGLVFVHGSLSTGANYSELAEDLAKDFTVYMPDRRGFGQSPYAGEWSVEKDAQDVAAVVAKAGAPFLFGYSLGAIVSLVAAENIASLKKLAIYEPPLFESKAAALPVVERVDRELREGKKAAAMTTAMKGAQLGAPFLNAMPHWLLTAMLKQMMKKEAKTGQSKYVGFGELAPTLHHDGHVILDVSGRQEEFKSIACETLLLGGGMSSAFMKGNLTRLESIIPQTRRKELPGLDHGSAQNRDVRGKPAPIAQALREFFKQ